MRTLRLLRTLALGGVLTLTGCGEAKQNRALARGEKKAAREDKSPAAKAEKARRTAEVLREAEKMRRRAASDLRRAKRLQEESRLRTALRNARVEPTLPRPSSDRARPSGRPRASRASPGLSAKREARIRQQLRGRVRGLRGCYLRTLITSPRLSSRAKISFVIETTGKVSGVKVETDLPETTRVCFAKRVATWTLAPPPKRTPYGPIRVRFLPGS